jgi:Acetyltransferases
VYADSEELKGILIVSDESDHRHAFYNYFVSLKESLVTDGWLIHEDPSTRTFWNFMLGKDYLNSAWTAQLHQTRRLHVIYLAVDPAYQHHGLAEMMMQEVIDQAEEHGMMISLETHNPKNVAFYEHLGFKTFGWLKSTFSFEAILHDKRIGFREAQLPLIRFLIPSGSE